MKSESLIYLTVLFSAIYFGLMKYEMSQPWDIIKLTIVFFATLLFIAWMIASYITAEDITAEEDKK
tara:strand:+ start:180 stop:377 length:198 start_codon:yes stop_codon:yes gene_type:complete